ncbi:tetratricopeptide repeat protein [Pedobacter cryophilus]|uniref:Tetratricopeptide repeat protein n=1 Tax=Pedobacter cryophilus TaxID=2571271 RepID=A0A4U1BZ96_9SPHI|nr:tetratricopeptide repeat protein [Pedobacter cryophilus]TKB98532.1 tetratricopeptide repeat protein [Pedobacter cryophilus]
MFSNSARIAVCGLLFLVAALAVYLKVYEVFALCLMFVGIVIWGYFKEGTVILAAKQYKLKNYDKAKTLLLSIQNPAYLKKIRKAYYEFLLGSIAINQLDYHNAEFHLGKAAVLGLRASDLGVALMHLSNISLRNQDKEKGLIWIRQADKLPLTEKYKSILSNIEKELQKI